MKCTVPWEKAWTICKYRTNYEECLKNHWFEETTHYEYNSDGIPTRHPGYCHNPHIKDPDIFEKELFEI